MEVIQQQGAVILCLISAPPRKAVNEEEARRACYGTAESCFWTEELTVRLDCFWLFNTGSFKKNNGLCVFPFRERSVTAIGMAE